MPFGQTRTEFDEGVGPVVEGKVVEGTVVEGTVVDGTDVVDGNIVLDGELLGAGPTTLLPPLALSSVGVEPTLLPNWLGGVPVMLGAGVTLNGEVVAAPGVAGDGVAIPGVVPIPGVVVAAPGVVAAAPGAADPAPAVPAPAAPPPTWASAGRATAASSASGKRRLRRVSSMGILLCYWLSGHNHASFIPTPHRTIQRQALENPHAAGIYLLRCPLSH
jgi:hypothetical protein